VNKASEDADIAEQVAGGQNKLRPTIRKLATQINKYKK
jgi:hypothetical protein